MTSEKLQEGNDLTNAIEQCTVITTSFGDPFPTAADPSTIAGLMNNYVKLDSTATAAAEPIDSDITDAINAACLDFLTNIKDALATIRTDKTTAFAALTDGNIES